MFSWKSKRLRAVGVFESAPFDRLPGASSDRSSQLPPLTGRSFVCRGSMLPASVDEVVWMSGASPVTVTDSWTVDVLICALTVSVWPTSASKRSATFANPGSSICIRYVPTRTGSR
jgi:hypothetical protein